MVPEEEVEGEEVAAEAEVVEEESDEEGEEAGEREEEEEDNEEDMMTACVCVSCVRRRRREGRGMMMVRGRGKAPCGCVLAEGLSRARGGPRDGCPFGYIAWGKPWGRLVVCRVCDYSEGGPRRSISLMTMNER